MAWASASSVKQHLSGVFVSGRAVFTLRVCPSSSPDHCLCSHVHLTGCARILDAYLTIMVKWLNCNEYFSLFIALSGNMYISFHCAMLQKPTRGLA